MLGVVFHLVLQHIDRELARHDASTLPSKGATPYGKKDSWRRLREIHAFVLFLY